MIGLITLLTALVADEVRSQAQRRLQQDLTRKLDTEKEARRAIRYTAMLRLGAERAYLDMQELMADIAGMALNSMLEQDPTTSELMNVNSLLHRKRTLAKLPSRDIISAAVGLPYLGHGAYRAAFRLAPGLVVKVALLPGDESMNALEAARYDELPEHLKRQVVPMVEVDYMGKWILVERAEKLPTVMSTEQQAQMERAAQEMLEYAKRTRMPLDLRWYNWGVHEERIKLLDLAS